VVVQEAVVEALEDGRDGFCFSFWKVDAIYHDVL
jgi:hypothetical protein